MLFFEMLSEYTQRKGLIKLKKLFKKYMSLMLTLVILAAMPGMETYAAEDTKKEDNLLSVAEKFLPEEVKALLEELELGEEEQKFLEELKEKLDAGELDSEEEILNAVSEAEEQFDISLTRKQKNSIVSLGLKVQELGLDSEEVTEMVENLAEKYADQIKKEAETVVQEKIVEPAKEAVKEKTKSAVKNFFGEMKRSLAGFWEKITN